MNTLRACFLLFAVSMLGCECRPSGVGGVNGEVRWEYEGPDGPEGGSSALITFPSTTMGGRSEQQVVVRNVGRASFTMNDFVQLTGATTLFNADETEFATFRVTYDPDATLAPTDAVTITVAFTPAITTTETVVDSLAELQLRPTGASSAGLTLSGRAIAGQCEVPAELDFGALPLGAHATQSIDLRNDGESPVSVTAGGVTGAPVGIFDTAGIDNSGLLTVHPGEAPTLDVTFQPTDEGDFTGNISIKRGESCPQRTVVVKGRGVTNCITWKAEPSVDMTYQLLHFGAVPPGSAGPGKITFFNACSVDASLDTLHTTEPVFVVTAPQTDLVPLPAATRAASGDWSPGTGVTELDFRPTVLGSKEGTFLANTSLVSQPGVAVQLRGFGGGPVINVQPTPTLAVGRIGYVVGAPEPLSVTRTVRIANVGNRPTPADPLINLHLGVPGVAGGPYYEVTAINGDRDELCVGEVDAAGQCTDTITAPLYDDAVGIEATPAAAINLPVRVTPHSAGVKEWDLVIHSNDVANPEVHVRITAEAIEAPPCNYSITPTTVAFGTMVQGQSKDLSFTLTNLGSQATEICYFNGVGLTAGSDAAFTLPGNPVDVELAPGASQAITVRASPSTAGTGVQSISGVVEMSVSSTVTPHPTVNLNASISPACLSVMPAPVAFPDTQLECGAPQKSVVINNACPNAVTLDSVVLADPAMAPMGTGTCSNAGGCAQFTLISSPATGVIQPGNSRSVVVGFKPYSLGANVGTLVVNVTQNGASVPYQVELDGAGIARTMQNCGVQVSCPGPITVGANSTVALPTTVTGQGSTTCHWSVGMRPATSSGFFSAPNSCSNTNYFADVVGTHVVHFDATDAYGSTGSCDVPITVNALGDFWVELTWDLPSDMDLHVLNSNGGGNPTSSTSWFTSWDVDYTNRNPTSWSTNPNSNPNLDRDDIGGTGPENTRINVPDTAVDYTIGVHSYGMYGNPSVTSTIRLYCGGALTTTQTHTSSHAKDMWIVGKVRFSNTSTCTFTPNGTVINVP